MMLELYLEEPIDFMGMHLIKVWFNVMYPTGYCTWALQNAEGASPIMSWFNFPQEVLNSWTDNDNVLFDYLRELKPWEEMIRQYEQSQGDNSSVEQIS